MKKENNATGKSKKDRSTELYAEEYPANPRTDKDGNMTVRRYFMTKDERKHWLSKYVGRTEKYYPEDSEVKRTPADKKRRRKKAAYLLVIVLVVIAVCAAIPVIRLVRSQFDIRTLKIEGECPYSGEELLKAAGYKIGDGLLELDTKKAADAILDSLPYLSSCMVTVSVPDTVIFTVKTDVPMIYIEVSGSYYSISQNLRVLSRSEDASVFAADGLIFTDLPKTKTAVVGRELVFEEDISTEYIKTFLNLLNEEKIVGDVSRFFLEDKYDIVMIFRGRYRIRFGSQSDSKLKLTTALAVMENYELIDGFGANIDVSTPSKAGIESVESFNPNRKNQNG